MSPDPPPILDPAAPAPVPAAPPLVLEYHAPDPPTRRATPWPLLAFAGCYVAAGLALHAWAVYGLGQFKPDLGADGSLAASLIAILLAANVATAAAVLTARSIRRATGRGASDWHHPLVCGGGGALCAVATFAPHVLFALLAAKFAPPGRAASPSPLGDVLGWISLVACPPIVAAALLRPRPASPVEQA